MAFNHVDIGYEPSDMKVMETSFGRFYESPTKKGKWYPSVTTVTGHAKKDFFAKWRQKEGNQKILQYCQDRGNLLHETIEHYLKNDNEYVDALSLVEKRHFIQVKESLDKIGNIRALEVPLWSDVLGLAGRVDCIAEFDGKLSVIDFKGSTKPKKESWIRNYFEQATCYSIMWKERTGERIDQIVVIISCDDGTNQLFVKDCREYVPSLKETIENYWNDILKDQDLFSSHEILEETKKELQERGVLNGLNS
jgi:hypothetical protein